jgi:hypothetical protein
MKGLPMFMPLTLKQAANSLRVLSYKALMTHLGLSKTQAILVCQNAELISLGRSSILFHSYLNGECGFSIVDKPSACGLGGGLAHGVVVMYHMDNDDNGLTVNFSAPYDALKKGCPDVGHIVYNVSCFSPERIDAMRRHGGVPVIPTEGAAKDQQVFSRRNLDLVTGGKFVTYIGKTSRGLYQRATEHLLCAYDNNGRKTRFHTALAGSDSFYPLVPSFHLVGLFNSSEAALDGEEALIKASSLLPDVVLLNTVSSREALKKLFELYPAEARTVEPEMAVERLQQLSAATAANWENASYAQSVICNNPNNFDVDDVFQIRMLARMNIAVVDIAKTLGAKAERVRNVIDKKTYWRIL